MDTFEPAIRALAKSYDDVPYDSRPFPQSHPAKLAGLARLFGLAPPDVATARILELGCAAGGNIIPMAVSYPQAHCVGVDLSPKQVAVGQARVAALGLTNIQLRNQSIMDLSVGHGQFDYIICHGVYSWVPQPVRDAILRVANENLSQNGVAYISYNVHPGWRLRGVLREAMLFHIQGIDAAADRAQAARSFLKQLAEITDRASAYGQMLRQEAAALAQHEDHYIIHEYLEHNNDPCYVEEFLRRARTAGLAYLTEANLNVTIAESFGPEAGRMLRELSGNRLDRMEQYIDFLTGRTFRQSLLVKGAQEAQIMRSLGPQCLEGLSLRAQIAQSEEPTTGSYVLRDGAGRSLTTTNATVRDAILALGRAFPAVCTPTELVESLPAEDEARRTEVTPQLNDALFKMVLIGMAEVCSDQTPITQTVSDRPLALSLARADAAAGRTWTTSACHETAYLSVVQRAILPLLDGTNDHAALAAALAQSARSGAISFLHAGEPVTDNEGIDAAAAEHLRPALAALAASAVLIG